MADPRSQVRDASDAQQVARAKRKAKDLDARWLGALRAVLQTPEGRLVFGDLQRGWIARWGAYRSIWEQSARIHYNAGKQDAAHEILADILRADEALYTLMEQEARAFARREDRDTAAAHTPSADQGDE